MNARRALFVAAGSISLFAVGCRNNNPPPTLPPPAPAPPTASNSPLGHRSSPGGATQPSDDDNVHGTAEVLAERAKTYARSMGSMLYRRPDLPEKPATKPVSDVADGAPDPDAQMLAQDAVSSAPEANKSAVASIDDHAGVVTPATTRPNRVQPSLAGAADGSASDLLLRRLSQQVKDYPQDLAGQLDYQLFQLVNGEAVPQLPVMAGLNSEDREVLAALLDGISNFRNVVRADNNLLLSRKIKPVLDVADRLRNQAELSIPTLELCSKVDGFGVYEPMDGARFAANKEQPVIIYCEVENFASQLTDKKLWETQLKQEIVLYTEQNGLEVWRDKIVKPIVDQSRNRRHDFFVVKMIRLPATLPVGRYLLKVSVEDQQVSRIAENTVAIQIVAQ